MVRRPRVPHHVSLVVLLAAAIAAGCDLLVRDDGPRWQAGEAAPVALTEVAVAAHEGRIWVAGGMDADGRGVTAVQVLDPATGSWSAGPELPEAVHHAALVSDGASLWLIGGYAGDGPSRRVYRLASGARLWLGEEGLPQPRAAGAAAHDERSRIVYAGGVGPDGVAAEVFVLEGRTWSRAGELRAPREHLAAAAAGDGTVYFLGGRRGGLDTNVATVEAVTLDGEIRTLPGLPTARGGVAAFWHAPTGACLVGGESPRATHAEVECTGDGEDTALPALRVARHGLGAAVVDGAAWVVLGGRRPGLHVSDVVERLTLP